LLNASDKQNILLHRKKKMGERSPFFDAEKNRQI
jgi:hypothetical protein